MAVRTNMSVEGRIMIAVQMQVHGLHQRLDYEMCCSEQFSQPRSSACRKLIGSHRKSKI